MAALASQVAGAHTLVWALGCRAWAGLAQRHKPLVSTSGSPPQFQGPFSHQSCCPCLAGKQKLLMQSWSFCGPVPPSWDGWGFSLPPGRLQPHEEKTQRMSAWSPSTGCLGQQVLGTQVGGARR